jgi:hypothetical protein
MEASIAISGDSRTSLTGPLPDFASGDANMQGNMHPNGENCSSSLSNESAGNSPPSPSSSPISGGAASVAENSATQPTKRGTNPKMLILDFKNPENDKRLEIHKVLIARTNIRDFSIKLLPKKGISILFRSAGAQKFAKPLLEDHFKTELQDRKLKFGMKKNVYEVVTQLPKGVNPEEVCRALDASSCKTRAGGMVVFFMKTALAAQKIIDDGLLFGDFLLNFKPFVYAPRVACQSCGSFEHKSCDLVICSYCCGDHAFADCPEDAIMKCKYCKESHNSLHCPIYAERKKDAFNRKKQSYADILKKSSPSSGNSSTRYGFINNPGSSTIDAASEIPDSECIPIAGHRVPKPVVEEIMHFIFYILKLDPSQQNLILENASLPIIPSSQDSSVNSADNQNVIVVSSAPDSEESAPSNETRCDFDPAGDLDRVDMDTSISVTKRSRSEISSSPSSSCIAKCNCGKEFVRCSQIQNHWKAKKHCRADAAVTCACGKQS